MATTIEWFYLTREIGYKLTKQKTEDSELVHNSA